MYCVVVLTGKWFDVFRAFGFQDGSAIVGELYGTNERNTYYIDYGDVKIIVITRTIDILHSHTFSNLIGSMWLVSDIELLCVNLLLAIFVYQYHWHNVNYSNYIVVDFMLTFSIDS